MGKLLRFLTALICTGACLGSAYAGPNEGGTLILALSEGTVYSPDIDYCDSVTTPDCEGAVTNAPAGTTPVVMNVLAAFPPPGGRLSGIVWGINYNPDEVFIIDFGPCGDFELPNSDWPATNSGTAITWLSPQLEELVPVYWFAAYAYDGAELNLGIHPTQGGQFGDDSIPSQLDDIAGFGSMGFGSNPGTVVCPVVGEPDGACCFPDGTCEITTEADCGGVYQGDDTVCDPNPCPDTITGACCFPDGTCQELNDADCATNGGIYQGDGTVCDPNPCAAPMGACCFPDGTCELTTEADCGGVYQGNGTVCDPNPCPDTITGACCFPDGACEITTEAGCGGVYQGDDTVCDPNPCPDTITGACCFADGSCIELNDADCAAAGGLYQGDDTVCDPNPCPAPTGACCFEDGTCQILDAEDCAAAGGAYEGDGTVCDPNPCPPIPTHESSWGEIKNLYR